MTAKDIRNEMFEAIAYLSYRKIKSEGPCRHQIKN